MSRVFSRSYQTLTRRKLILLFINMITFRYLISMAVNERFDMRLIDVVLKLDINIRMKILEGVKIIKINMQYTFN